MMIMLPSSSSTTSSPASSRLSLLTSSSSISSTLSASVPSSSSKTHAFFGSPFSDSSSPPLPPPYDDTPKVDTHPPPRSLNTDFFSTSPPTIPSSPTSSPPRKTILPPLSRFFPSRARLSSRTTHPQFFHLDTSSPPSPTSSPEPESPSSAERASPDPSSHHPNLSHPVHPLKQGDVLADSALSLELLRTLGQGAFSSVWLAKDLYSQLPALESSRRSSLVRSRSKKKNRPIDGTSHQRALTDANGRLVAVKMTDRRLCDRNDRSRVSFIREVQVLRHISHPSIVSYLHSFSTSSHHCLVLEHISGGELFDLIDSQECHSRVDEPLLRRMFGELCKAVGWMHAVGLVHRDIKLENILLTTNPFQSPLPSSPLPLIKLTDFGLSRFIDPSHPLLTTRCGSESYAAPELVTGRPYDGRETDAWACGVVLFAVATRRLPFDRVSSWERERQGRSGEEEKSERKALLFRIAKGEYVWPAAAAAAAGGGNSLGESEGLKRVVAKLLVRDPSKRARVGDVWEDEWMKGVGAPSPPTIPPDEEGEGEEEEEDGLLVDGQEIGPGHVVRQEH